MKNKTKRFPCPACTRQGLSPASKGDCVDVGDRATGPLMMQIAPDEVCGCCDGEGFIEVGSAAHFAIKAGSIYDYIWKMFPIIDSLPEIKFKTFWSTIGSTIESLETLWLNENRQPNTKRKSRA